MLLLLLLFLLVFGVFFFAFVFVCYFVLFLISPRLTKSFGIFAAYLCWLLLFVVLLWVLKFWWHTSGILLWYRIITFMIDYCHWFCFLFVFFVVGLIVMIICKFLFFFSFLSHIYMTWKGWYVCVEFSKLSCKDLTTIIIK